MVYSVDVLRSAGVHLLAVVSESESIASRCPPKSLPASVKCAEWTVLHAKTWTVSSQAGVTQLTHRLVHFSLWAGFGQLGPKQNDWTAVLERKRQHSCCFVMKPCLRTGEMLALASFCHTRVPWCALHRSLPGQLQCHVLPSVLNVHKGLPCTQNRFGWTHPMVV